MAVEIAATGSRDGLRTVEWDRGLTHPQFDRAAIYRVALDADDVVVVVLSRRRRPTARQYQPRP